MNFMSIYANIYNWTRVISKIFEQGPPEKIFDDPQNERTKQFLHAVLDAN